MGHGGRDLLASPTLGEATGPGGSSLATFNVLARVHTHLAVVAFTTPISAEIRVFSTADSILALRSHFRPATIFCLHFFSRGGNAPSIYAFPVVKRRFGVIQ